VLSFFSFLLAAEFCFDRAKDAYQGRTDAEHDNDDRDADAGGNEAVNGLRRSSVLCRTEGHAECE